MVIVRFRVGEDEEKSIVRLQSKLMANADRIPCCVTPPLIKPRYIDDVPILALTFWSKNADHLTLRRVAAEVEDRIKREPDASLTTLIGGVSRRIEVRIDPVRLAAYGLDPNRISQMIFAANQASDAGRFPSREGQIIVHTSGFLKTLEDVKKRGGECPWGQSPCICAMWLKFSIDAPRILTSTSSSGAGPAGHEKGLFNRSCR